LGEVWLDTAEDRGDNSALRKALEALEPVASQSSASSRILGLYGRALALNGQDDEAEREFKLAAETFPTDPTMLPQFAAVAERRGHLEDAREALERYAVLVDDDHDQAMHAAQIGDLSLQLNDAPSAVSWYEKSVALATPDAGILAHLADAQLKTGHAETARDTIARALAKDAKNPSVRAVALRIQRVAQAIPEKVEPQHQ
jgi:Flp pilus assembly protein TadD